MSDEQLAMTLPEQGKRRWAPPEPIVRKAEVERIGNWNYRWTMTRAWGAGPCIAWFGLNPSDANGERDDPSTHRMMGFSWRWGFGSMLVLNVNPVVTSSPVVLEAWRRQMQSSVTFVNNIERIKALLPSFFTCVAAWGNGASPIALNIFLEGVRPVDDWRCIGTNSDGSPTHPLARGRNRIPDDAKLKIWREGSQ